MKTRSERVALVFALSLVASVAHAQETPPPEPPPNAEGTRMDEYREQLREAAADYHAGRYAEAIVKYQKVYGLVGARTGYRIAFNLGRAYESHGEPRLAAESYQTYLDEVARRRNAGETIEQKIVDQEAEAHERITELAKKLGRIHVLAGGDRATIAQVDQSAPRIAEVLVYVDPGDHRVTFGTGRDATHVDVRVAAGESVDVAPPAAEPPPPPPPPTRYEPRREHPFSPIVLWVAGGVAVVSVIVPVVTYANALSTKSDYDGARSANDRERAQQLQSDYDGAKGTAYASLAVPAIFAAGAITLGAWYVLGTKDVLVPVPVVTKDSASAALQGRF
ncbi:MAG TPA: hypothetical protein VIF62_14260 [Labilithrix sp.]|jgi:hypothetical protein